MVAFSLRELAIGKPSIEGHDVTYVLGVCEYCRISSGAVSFTVPKLKRSSGLSVRAVGCDCFTTGLTVAHRFEAIDLPSGGTWALVVTCYAYD